MNRPSLFAIVIGAEMDAELVRGPPHTPSVVENGVNYANGAYISTILANVDRLSPRRLPNPVDRPLLKTKLVVNKEGDTRGFCRG